ncbi:hypothetical protein [Dokdonia sp.]|uniref:hypothetical protein n=1 Tax=Dokdonia sp. TaxID=2024995 RepID=UPI003265B348
MKHILTLIALCLTITVAAQRGPHRERTPLNPEEQATLQTKKMTLALALDTQQADKVYQIQLEQARKRKAFLDKRKKEEGAKPTKEQRLEMQNKKLDAMIAVQNEMKKILTEDQFKEWKTLARKKQQKRRKKHHKRRK